MKNEAHSTAMHSLESAVPLQDGRLTSYVIIASVVAASGGLLFGYDLGVTGGVVSMAPFLHKFFPDVYLKQQEVPTAATSAYCKFDSQVLSLFQSSLFIAAMFGGFVGCFTTVRIGRVKTMLYAGLLFFAGGIICGAAVNIIMLVVGRVTLGVAVGMAAQAVPLYLSEMAPENWRGALNQLFELAVTVGVLAAELINYGTNHVSFGWRISLALTVVPATVLIIGGLFCPETPNSLVERGHTSKGRRILQRARGEDANIEVEFSSICAAAEFDENKNNFAIFKPEYRPQLVWAILIPSFQQLTGINAILAYAAPFFVTLGFGSNTALLLAIATGVVFLLSTFMSIFFVDRVGRRWLFMIGGIQMLMCQVATGVVLYIAFPPGVGSIPLGAGVAVVVIICGYTAAFGWGWGPLAWLVPSEIHTLETRSMGQAITVAFNFLFTFIIGQTFLSMLCAFKYGIFWFFGGWVLIMTLAVYFFLPETNGVPLESMREVWANHWYWRKWSLKTNSVAQAPSQTAQEISPISDVDDKRISLEEL